ncbi:AN1-type zinc finger protein 1 [Mactra antiquata]
MDSEVTRDGRLMDFIDEKWREDQLPEDDIAVPETELPEVEQSENGPSTETLKEQEQKWTDLGLSILHDQPPTSNNS